MIRVGFIGLSGEWLGGQNYLKNLLYAISKIKDRMITPVIFLGTGASRDTIDAYSQYAEIITTPLLDRYSLLWVISRSFGLLGCGQGLFESFLLKNDIRVIFHTPSLFAFHKVRDIAWIADFQHMHLGELFTKRDLISRDKSFKVAATTSGRIILSSRDAMKDLELFSPGASSKARVLTFVGQVDRKFFDFHEKDIQLIREKYDLPAKFLYLPNQFWKHKNHAVVFEAIRLLKSEGLDVVLVCSGSMDNCRNKEHSDGLREFIVHWGLQKNILLLGRVPFEHVFLLYAASLAVVNPSLFEGWSTTVEECKSIGKKILLSDIPVHREQDPVGGIYFDPKDPKSLADKIRMAWSISEAPGFLNTKDDLRNRLEDRTAQFGDAFQTIIEDMCT